eukprot:Rhum_TRINITY_DN11783_c0_g2::Rhum_TRINITY_DN11783_c0_g2_i1::g.46852::m.46852
MLLAVGSKRSCVRRVSDVAQTGVAERCRGIEEGCGYTVAGHSQVAGDAPKQNGSPAQHGLHCCLRLSFLDAAIQHAACVDASVAEKLVQCRLRNAGTEGNACPTGVAVRRQPLHLFLLKRRPEEQQVRVRTVGTHVLGKGSRSKRWVLHMTHTHRRQEDVHAACHALSRHPSLLEQRAAVRPCSVVRRVRLDRCRLRDDVHAVCLREVRLCAGAHVRAERHARVTAVHHTAHRRQLLVVATHHVDVGAAENGQHLRPQAGHGCEDGLQMQAAAVCVQHHHKHGVDSGSLCVGNKPVDPRLEPRNHILVCHVQWHDRRAPRTEVARNALLRGLVARGGAGRRQKEAQRLRACGSIARHNVVAPTRPMKYRYCSFYN